MIKVERVSKTFRYRPYARGSLTLKTALLDLLLLRPRPPLVEVHALDQVSIEVKPGEIVALVGRNGAGKSTLLRLVAGVYKPDTGSVHVEGRIGTLLEIGTGFHPELSGRENVEIAGLLAGLSRREVRERAPAIASFAEIGEFLDAPVRTYSTGMVLRLGFAVAAEIEPRVLLVDEALAVGDPGFQRKCLERIFELKRKGTALLVVTHDLSVVEAHCDRAYRLEAGRVVGEGAAATVARAMREAP
ncbi:MAG TPA: ABC transporter ATP-binding protein [Planctomycetota bacterium]|nr:ABC transporter ATP-binding protein [Planctomycetota bacterium]